MHGAILPNNFFLVAFLLHNLTPCHGNFFTDLFDFSSTIKYFHSAKFNVAMKLLKQDLYKSIMNVRSIASELAGDLAAKFKEVYDNYDNIAPNEILTGMFLTHKKKNLDLLAKYANSTEGKRNVSKPVLPNSLGSKINDLIRSINIPVAAVINNTKLVAMEIIKKIGIIDDEETYINITTIALPINVTTEVSSATDMPSLDAAKKLNSLKSSGNTSEQSFANTSKGPNNTVVSVHPEICRGSSVTSKPCLESSKVTLNQNQMPVKSNAKVNSAFQDVLRSMYPEMNFNESAEVSVTTVPPCLDSSTANQNKIGPLSQTENCTGSDTFNHVQFSTYPDMNNDVVTWDAITTLTSHSESPAGHQKEILRKEKITTEDLRFSASSEIIYDASTQVAITTLSAQKPSAEGVNKKENKPHEESKDASGDTKPTTKSSLIFDVSKKSQSHENENKLVNQSSAIITLFNSSKSNIIGKFLHLHINSNNITIKSSSETNKKDNKTYEQLEDNSSGSSLTTISSYNIDDSNKYQSLEDENRHINQSSDTITFFNSSKSNMMEKFLNLYINTSYTSNNRTRNLTNPLQNDFLRVENAKKGEEKRVKQSAAIVKLFNSSKGNSTDKYLLTPVKIMKLNNNSVRLIEKFPNFYMNTSSISDSFTTKISQQDDVTSTENFEEVEESTVKQSSAIITLFNSSKFSSNDKFLHSPVKMMKFRNATVRLAEKITHSPVKTTKFSNEFVHLVRSTEKSVHSHAKTVKLKNGTVRLPDTFLHLPVKMMKMSNGTSFIFPSDPTSWKNGTEKKIIRSKRAVHDPFKRIIESRWAEMNNDNDNEEEMPKENGEVEKEVEETINIEQNVDKQDDADPDPASFEIPTPSPAPVADDADEGGILVPREEPNEIVPSLINSDDDDNPNNENILTSSEDTVAERENRSEDFETVSGESNQDVSEKDLPTTKITTTTLRTTTTTSKAPSTKVKRLKRPKPTTSKPKRLSSKRMPLKNKKTDNKTQRKVVRNHHNRTNTKLHNKNHKIDNKPQNNVNIKTSDKISNLTSIVNNRNKSNKTATETTESTVSQLEGDQFGKGPIADFVDKFKHIIMSPWVHGNYEDADEKANQNTFMNNPFVQEALNSGHKETNHGNARKGDLNPKVPSKEKNSTQIDESLSEDERSDHDSSGTTPYIQFVDIPLDPLTIVYADKMERTTPLDFSSKRAPSYRFSTPQSMDVGRKNNLTTNQATNRTTKSKSKNSRHNRPHKSNNTSKKSRGISRTTQVLKFASTTSKYNSSPSKIVTNYFKNDFRFSDATNKDYRYMSTPRPTESMYERFQRKIINNANLRKSKSNATIEINSRNNSRYNSFFKSKAGSKNITTNRVPTSKLLMDDVTEPMKNIVSFITENYGANSKQTTTNPQDPLKKSFENFKRIAQLNWELLKNKESDDFFSSDEFFPESVNSHRNGKKPAGTMQEDDRKKFRNATRYDPRDIGRYYKNATTYSPWRGSSFKTQGTHSYSEIPKNTYTNFNPSIQSILNSPEYSTESFNIKRDQLPDRSDYKQDNSSSDQQKQTSMISKGNNGFFILPLNPDEKKDQEDQAQTNPAGHEDMSPSQNVEKSMLPKNGFNKDLLQVMRNIFKGASPQQEDTREYPEPGRSMNEDSQDKDSEGVTKKPKIVLQRNYSGLSLKPRQKYENQFGENLDDHEEDALTVREWEPTTPSPFKTRYHINRSVSKNPFLGSVQPQLINNFQKFPSKKRPDSMRDNSPLASKIQSQLISPGDQLSSTWEEASQGLGKEWEIMNQNDPIPIKETWSVVDKNGTKTLQGQRVIKFSVATQQQINDPKKGPAQEQRTILNVLARQHFSKQGDQPEDKRSIHKIESRQEYTKLGVPIDDTNDQNFFKDPEFTSQTVQDNVRKPAKLSSNGFMAFTPKPFENSRYFRDYSGSPSSNEKMDYGRNYRNAEQLIPKLIKLQEALQQTLAMNGTDDSSLNAESEDRKSHFKINPFAVNPIRTRHFQTKRVEMAQRPPGLGLPKYAGYRANSWKSTAKPQLVQNVTTIVSSIDDQMNSVDATLSTTG